MQLRRCLPWVAAAVAAAAPCNPEARFPWWETRDELRRQALPPWLRRLVAEDLLPLAGAEPGLRGLPRALARASPDLSRALVAAVALDGTGAVVGRAGDPAATSPLPPAAGCAAALVAAPDGPDRWWVALPWTDPGDARTQGTVHWALLAPGAQSGPDAGPFVVIAAAGATLAACAVLVALLVHSRGAPEVKAGAPNFLLLSLAGCALWTGGAVALALPADGTGVCRARAWTLSLGRVLAVAPLLAKNFRVWRLFQASEHPGPGASPALDDRTGFARVAALALVQVAALVAGELAGSPAARRRDGGGAECWFAPAYVAGTAAYVAALHAAGFALALLSRRLPERFLDNRELALVGAATAAAGVVGAAARALPGVAVAAGDLVDGFCGLLVLWLALALVFTRRLLRAVEPDPPPASAVQVSAPAYVSQSSRFAPSPGAVRRPLQSPRDPQSLMVAMHRISPRPRDSLLEAPREED